MNWISFKCQVFINTLTFREKENAAPVRWKDVFNNRLKVTTKLQKTHCNPLIWMTIYVEFLYYVCANGYSLGSLLIHQRSLLTSLVMPNSDLRDRSFYPTLTHIKDSYAPENTPQTNGRFFFLASFQFTLR